MRHLYNCRVEILELVGAMTNGSRVMSWEKITGIPDPYLGVPGEMMCRLDVGFLRPGRDQPMPIVAGRAPDRIGVVFYDVTDVVKAGHRLRVLSGPVTGTFELRAIPDPAQDSTPYAHHMEVQVVEVAKALQGVFPGGNFEEATPL